MANGRTVKWHVWKNIPAAKLWELVALSLNIDPGSVEIDPHSWMADRTIFSESDEFSDRLLIAERNLTSGVLRAQAIIIDEPYRCTVALDEFAAWALSIHWQIPDELATLAWTALTQSNESASQPSENHSAITVSNQEKSLGTREKESLLKLVITMAIEGYKYNPAETKNDATKDIADDLAKQGVPLDEDTVRKWLKEGAKLIPKKQ